MKNSNSIKKRIILSYLIIVGVVILLSMLIMVFNYFLINQYERVNHNMVEIQALNNEAGGLVGDAYNGFQTNHYNKYDERLVRVRKIQNSLDESFIDNQASFIAYRGVKNSLEVVIKNISLAREKIQENNDLNSISTFYKDNSTQYDYVSQGITDLVLAETVNLAKVTEQMEKLKTALVYLIILVIVVGIIFITILAVIFSNWLMGPLVSLAQATGKITPDNLEFNVDQKMMDRKDEVGDLFRAFKGMVDQIRIKIEEIGKSNAQINKAKQEAEESLRDVEKLNKVMIGRELQMIELKNEIATLKEELAKHA